VSGALTEGSGRVTVGHRVIANQIPRAGVRTTLTVRALPSLTVGVEYNPRADDVGPLLNWVALSETHARPAVILGTSSDRIGTPSGRSYYLTASKALHDQVRLPISPYVGAAYGEYERKTRLIGGVNIGLPASFSSTIIFDGVHVHPLLNYARGKFAASFILARGREPGISYSFSF
jgi:hypothetical protein